MKITDIIRQLMQSGPFNLGGFRYFLDFDGSSWIVKRVRLSPDGNYNASDAVYVCHFTI